MDLGFDPQLIDPAPRRLTRMLGYSALGLVGAAVVALRIMMWMCPGTIEDMGHQLAEALGFTHEQTAMILHIDDTDSPCIYLDDLSTQDA